MKRYIIGILGVILGVIADQYTKYLAVTHLKSGSIPIIENVFVLHYLENRGAAFGILQNQQWFFVSLTLIFLVSTGIIYAKLPRVKKLIPLQCCLIFIISGAIGNLIDRIRLNYVIDFFYFKLIDFPIFNIADIFVSVSTCVIVFLILFYYDEEDFDMITHSILKKQEKTNDTAN